MCVCFPREHLTNIRTLLQASQFLELPNPADFLRSALCVSYTHAQLCAWLPLSYFHTFSFRGRSLLSVGFMPSKAAYSLLLLLSIQYTSKLLSVTAQPRAHSLLIGASLRDMARLRGGLLIARGACRILGCLLALADLGNRDEI